MSIASVGQLEELLSEPRDYVIQALAMLDGDLVILGGGGKMGPSLARMARRASEAAGIRRRVVAVSVEFAGDSESMLRQAGVETITCDLTEAEALAALPDAPNVVYMVGVKFGTSGNEPMTWAMNAYLPGEVCRRYRASRIAAFSTGNVYGLVPVGGGGSLETDLLEPIGEYAASALGRERVCEYFSRKLEVRVALVRLNYACEMRYGVLVDLGQKVWAGQPVELEMGYLNAIWQADASAMALASLSHAASPPFVLNVAGPETLSVREVAEEFGKLMGKAVRLDGNERPDAFLSNGGKAFSLFGKPQVTAKQMIPWIADWVMRGGDSLGKPTHFESRDGKY